MLRGYKGTVVADDWAIGAQQCCAPTGSRFARWDALKLAPTTSQVDLALDIADFSGWGFW